MTHRLKVSTTQSKEASGKGSASASASMNRTGGVGSLGRGGGGGGVPVDPSDEAAYQGLALLSFSKFSRSSPRVNELNWGASKQT